MAERAVPCLPWILSGFLLLALCASTMSCRSAIASAGLELSMPGYWKNAAWVGLTPLPTLDTKGSSVTSLYISGSDVYAGGYCDDSSGKYVPGYWKNSTWVGLMPPHDASADWEVGTLVVVGGSVYASAVADYDTAPDPPVATNGYWKDGAWVTLPLPASSGGGLVDSLAVTAGGDIYAGGCSYTLGDMESTTDLPGYWENGVWKGLTGPSGTYSGEITCLAVSGSDVYAGGWCVVNAGSGSGKQVAGLWLDGTWTALSPSTSTDWWNIISLVVSGGNVYAVGNDEGDDGSSSPGFWKNGVWTVLEPQSYTLSAATSLSVSNGVIYVGGFIEGSTTRVPGYWGNGVWTGFTPFSNSKNNYQAMVNAIAVSGTDVYAGGRGPERF